MIVFVTEMLRYGGNEAHHYIIGAYSTDVQARFAGECEVSYRGGKYDYRITELEVDVSVPQDIWENHHGLHTKD